MPLTIDEQIAAEAFTRLETCEGVTSVVRTTKRINDWIPQDGLLLLIKSSPSRLPILDLVGNPPVIGWQVLLIVYCHVLQSVNETDPVDIAQSTLAANALKSLTQDSQWHSFGGVAVNSQIGDIRRTTKDSFDVWAVQINVQYRTLETNPLGI